MDACRIAQEKSTRDHAAVVALLAGLTLCAGVTSADTKAEDLQPTAMEVRLLELTNRARQDPKADGIRLAPPGTEPKFRGLVFQPDWQLFRDEMAAIAASGPLVFDLRLLKSARAHSRYMIQHGQGHGEEPGKAGFTGTGPGARARAAGYTGRLVGENVFSRATDADHAHAAFIIDWGAKEIQPARGHRRNMLSRMYKQAGFAAVPNGREFSITQVFSASRSSRHAGGVIFTDKNGDRFYDIGEGIKDARLRIDDRIHPAWDSGAYTVRLPKTAKTITLLLGDLAWTRPIPPGRTNVKIDWIIPSATDLRRIDMLLNRLEAADPPLVADAIELQSLAEGVTLDDTRHRRTEAITTPILERVESLKSAVRKSADGDSAKFNKDYAALAAVVRGTPLTQWLLDARTYHRQKIGLAAKSQRIARTPADRQAEMWSIVHTGLQRTAKTMKTDEWKQRLLGLIDRPNQRQPSAESPAR